MNDSSSTYYFLPNNIVCIHAYRKRSSILTLKEIFRLNLERTTSSLIEKLVASILNRKS